MSSQAKLAITEHETWIREFVIERNGARLGEMAWDAEFVLTEPDDSLGIIHRSTVANGQIAWLDDGILRVTIPKSEVDRIECESAAFFLRVIDGSDTTVDPEGMSYVVCRGTLDYYRAAASNPRGMRVY